MCLHRHGSRQADSVTVNSELLPYMKIISDLSYLLLINCFCLRYRHLYLLMFMPDRKSGEFVAVPSFQFLHVGVCQELSSCKARSLLPSPAASCPPLPLPLSYSVCSPRWPRLTDRDLGGEIQHRSELSLSPLLRNLYFSYEILATDLSVTTFVKSQIPCSRRTNVSLLR